MELPPEYIAVIALSDWFSKESCEFRLQRLRPVTVAWLRSFFLKINAVAPVTPKRARARIYVHIAMMCAGCIPNMCAGISL